MEEFQERPNLGDVFCPPRLGLDDENEYLANMGLIILISGLPSPDMPRLLATKLASVYGSHPNNFPVYEASITPYVVACTNTRVRDAIVQGGIYSIPNRRIRFTVHEWRPRFGLGHDPTTHQVWVRLVGLPLQAWTNKEITAFLQKFGHPIDIMPYGQEAGHYRDITALVNTGHPSRIPLAYKYREGDYSTLVQVIILSARQWVPGFFPPLDDQINQQIALPRQQHGLCPGGSQRNRTQNSSSSSESAPSEPTIDLSCWSPRSHQTSPTMVWKWKIKKKQPKQNQKIERNGSKIVPAQPMLTCLISLDGSILLSASFRGHRSDDATADHLVTKDPHGARVSIRVSISTIGRCHIAENLLAMLTTPLSDRSTLGELPLNPAQPPQLESYRTLLTSHKQEMTAPTTPTLDLTPLHRNVDAPLSDLYPPPFSALINPNQVNAGQTPNKPIFLTYHTLWAVLTPTISQILRAHSAGPLTLTRCSKQPHCEDGLQMLPGNHLFRSDTLGPTSQQFQLTRHLLAMSDTVDPTAQQAHELKQPLSSGGHITSYQVTESNRTVQEQNERDQDSETAEMSQLSPILCARAHTVGKKKKGKQIATRRSPRLQAKRSVPHTMAKLSDRAKSLTAKLIFDHTTADAPIDAGTALTILQASGLEITKQVHEMIEEAVRQDTQAEQEEDRSPTTPLHNHIPPLLMPGADLPL